MDRRELNNVPPSATLRDALHRPLRDLRISVTDRCNFRCTYCMPKEIFGADFHFLHRDELLSFEEITRLARIFVALGVRKIRITGGEPLLRRDLETLIAMLSELADLEDLTLTTNGALLAKKARALRAAGLHRITVSLDSLDDTIFAAMNGVDFPVSRVLEGIHAAREAGFAPIKINAMIKRGVNDDGIVEMVQRFCGPEFILRFIEYMDVGNLNGWRREDVVSGAEIVEKIARETRVEALPPNYRGEVAQRFRHAAGGEIGVITSVTQPFCGDCSRARLSSSGELYTCLFASRGFDLRTLLRDRGASDAEIVSAIRKIWTVREDRYSELRAMRDTAASTTSKVEMSHIGG